MDQSIRPQIISSFVEKNIRIFAGAGYYLHTVWRALYKGHELYILNILYVRSLVGAC